MVQFVRGREKRHELLIRSLEFAADKHRMQRRKDEDASLYINHAIALMKVLCIEAGGLRDPTILSAAALHDTIEDTETTGQELESEFGSDIASIVSALTGQIAAEGGAEAIADRASAPHELGRCARKACGQDVGD